MCDSIWLGFDIQSLQASSYRHGVWSGSNGARNYMKTFDKGPSGN
jgi:hypothetical protein